MKDLESLPTFRVRGLILPRDADSVYGERTSAADVIDFLDANKEASDVVIDISSDGGSVAESKEIFTRLRNSGKKITTITHRAMSAATLIMLVGHKRLIVEGGDFLLHSAGYDDLRGTFRLEDMERLTRELAIATDDMLNFYCRILGEDKRMSIMGAMAKDSNLGAREAIKLGFATGYYKKNTVEASTAGRGVLITAYYQELIKNNMAADKDIMSKVEEKINNSFKAFFRSFNKIKNQSTLKLASGADVSIEPVSPDAPNDLVGATVFEVDETGLPTTNPLADGEHPLQDGRVLVVSGGVVTEVKEAVDANKLQEEVATLKAENAALKAEKESAVAAAIAKVVAEKDAEIQAAVKEVSKIQMQYNEFRKQVPGEIEKKDDDILKPADMSQMTTAQRVRAMSKERAKLQQLK